MILSRFGYCLLALASAQGVSSTSWAQPVAPGAPSSPPAIVPVAAATKPSTGPAGEEGRAPDAEYRPRIIRGNDQVLAPAKPAFTPTGGPLTFSFEDAPIADVVRTVLGDILGVPYVLHPPIAGTVTLASRSAIPPDQAVFLLESALQANGLALARDARGTYHVGRAEMLRNVGSDVRQATPRAPLSPGYGAIVVPLNFIGAGEMAAILRPMVPADAIIRVDSVRNVLVLNGTRTQAEGWLELVNTFDVDLLKGMSVGVFPLKYATVKEVEAALQMVGGGGAATTAALPQGAGSSAAARAQAGGGQAAALGEGNPLFGALRIMPIERINSILVVTPRAAYLDEARRWIERLDQPSDNGGEPQLHIYQVKNGNARHLASVLTGIFGGQSTATGGVANTGVAPGLATGVGSTFGQQALGGSAFGTSAFGVTGAQAGSGGLAGGAFGNRTSGIGASLNNRPGQGANAAGQQPAAASSIGGIRIMADELNNSVLVWGTRADYTKIESTLKRLDLPLTQVLIEASIVEVTLNDDLRYGLQWAFNDSRAGTDYTGRGVLSTVAGNAAGGLLGNALAGFSYTLKSPSGDVRAMLNALSAKTTVKVVASPSLMVLDNHTASIAVGNQTPIRSATSINTDGTRETTSIQYKDTGVNLVVTPSVNSGNIVTMQVDQSVTDVGAKDEVTEQRAFLQRQLSSKVAVRSGESIVMGGLIQENSTTTKSGIPVLHTLPLLGNLFGSTLKDGRRTELLVVITPRVVRADVEIKEVSDDLRDRMQGLKALQTGQSPNGANPPRLAVEPAQ